MKLQNDVEVNRPIMKSAEVCVGVCKRPLCYNPNCDSASFEFQLYLRLAECDEIIPEVC